MAEERDWLHPHMRFREVAEPNTILRVQVGSGVHGTAVSGQDDRDEMGVCLEPAQYVTGLDRFEQYEYHTAWERGGLSERSGAGDLDVVIYSARKWLRLALQGNPTVLLPLFVPEAEIVAVSPLGYDLRANVARIVSKRCGARFLGYMRAQRDGMLGLRSRDVNRPELVARYGYDTKYAMHMLRLTIQGIELLSTGAITLPIAEPQLSMLRKVRTGGYNRREVLDLAASLEADLEQLLETTALPAEPDHEWANQWLYHAYTTHWQAHC